ncbi:MAG: PQQ-binding-like beta-propeller repeat protein [bacterium]
MKNQSENNWRHKWFQGRGLLPGLILFLFLAVFIAVYANYSWDEIKPPETELPGMGSWPQFHGDGANHGVYLASSTFAHKPKWSVDVGHVIHSSPVVSGDHTVYIGNLEGELIAIHRLGLVKWRLNLGEPITSSPAVSSTGVVYVVTTHAIDEEEDKYISTLHTVTPAGVLVRSITLPDTWTTASPKIWRSEDNEYIFLSALWSSLLVYDQAGNLVKHAQFSGCPIHGGSPIWDWLGDLFDVLKEAFDEWPEFEFDTEWTAPTLYEQFGWLYPTVTVIDAPVFFEHPIVIFADNACFIKAYSWEPPKLTFLWSKQHEMGLLSSPARLRGTKTVVFGTKGGDVVAYDILTGDKLWKTGVDGGAVMGTPASRGIGLPIYVVSYDGTLTSLRPSDGSEIKKIAIEGTTISSPAASSDLVYVHTSKGLVSLSFNFESWAATTSAKGGGLASPAIGPDGTVYVVVNSADTGILRAYGGNPIFELSGAITK